MTRKIISFHTLERRSTGIMHELASAGGEYIVTHYGVPIGKLVPLGPGDREAVLEAVAASTAAKIKPKKQRGSVTPSQPATPVAVTLQVTESEDRAKLEAELEAELDRILAANPYGN